MNNSYLFKILLVFILVQSPIIFAFQSNDVQKNNKLSPTIISGVDYRVLPRRSLEAIVDLAQLQKVVDIEIFYWYGCETCLQVELALAEYLQAHPDIAIKRTPLVAYSQWRPQAYIQPILTQLKLLKPELTIPTNQEIYKTCLSDCSVFNRYESILQWLQEKLQLSEFPRLDEAAIWQSEKDVRKRADFYSISQVPTIIIRESHSVDANSAKSLTRLIDIVDHLLHEVTKP